MNRSSADHDRIESVPLAQALSERYLAYALSTITSRSLPDVRDGLKPVQRRLLYAMLQLRLDPAGGYKKCARVVGDVIGKFHPHGDQSVYDALVRLAQDFAQRYPLVEGQGNFGNIDGDNPAAMRYTESRLTKYAMALLENIDDDTVDFRPTYDGSEEEPVILPAAVPNLLANGASGIAVGMATSILPHNVGELCDALLFMLDRPAEAPLPTASEIMRFVPGPDLPTGGILIDPPATIAQAVATGRGGFRLRARYQVEQLPLGQYRIIVDQIPYQVQKSRLIEDIAEQLLAKKLPLLADLRDESTDQVRIVLVPRARTVEPELLMEQLFRATDLEVRLSLNLNVLDATGTPRVMGLAEVLQCWLDHRMIVLERRSRFRLGKIDDRLHILEGYLRAYLDIDEVIRIIREEDEPKPALMKRFELSEIQAEAILNLRLRNLRRLEEMDLRKEHAQLEAEKAKLTRLLAEPKLRRKALADEVKASRKAFADPRRTTFGTAPVIEPERFEAQVERFPVTILLSQHNWIRTARGHQLDLAEQRYKEGDAARFALEAQTTDRLLVFAADGKMFTLTVDRLPSGRGTGEPLSLFVDMAKGVPIIDAAVHRPGGKLVVATRAGRGFVVDEAAIVASTKVGRQVVDLDEGDQLVKVVPVKGDHLAVLGSHRRLLVFPLDQLKLLSRGKGVQLMKLHSASVVDIATIDPKAGFVWQTGSRQRREDTTTWIGERSQSGRATPVGFPKDLDFTRS
ncbi:MAG TPA: DNA topoisomerase IV subunit A [Geminicoccus sp.]|jgi:topoisomerase-4 subunit A|uniref:DNA topoisomerase IV subunit A n=1 Tax=Geminicoccus sp. TaxID=2024832 RepID=UPI002E31F05A|nr:DNA topoisomerase IV subunit A [Geminicoccus sp.]HEX2526576.1 DNA topoisomerase IV subunit A [Geminicoccus sp.]